MKRSLEEQKIRQWFRDARQADAASAPDFAATLAARPTPSRAGRRVKTWRVAVAAVAIVVIGVAAFVFFTRSAAPPDLKAATPLESVESPLAEPLPNSFALNLPTAIKRRPGRVSTARRKPRPDAGMPALLSLKWQSPTDFLLRTPGADLLKSVPSVGDSLIRLDRIHPDQKN